MIRLFKLRMNENFFKLLIVSGFIVLITVSFFTKAFSIKADIYNKVLFANRLIIPFSIISVIAMTNILYRTILFILYKPVKINKLRPSITIVIPAYNEGPMILNSIKSVIEADYPNDKREVICVNDGSTDDTLKYIKKAKKKYGKRLDVISYKKNKGKREALAEGFRKAKGEIIITIDSDSVIDNDAFLHLVAPFIDKKVGAVTGNVQVYNKRKNLLTRMVGVRYAMAFDFYRATQSTIRTVFCCSGVLSAYRKDVLDKVMDKWLHQKFLGTICTIGDDRALTNYVLRSGYDTMYARKAIARTIVPHNIPKLLRMVLRWNKSFYRETIYFFKFAFSSYRVKNRIMPLVDYFLVLSMLIMQFQLYIILVYYVSLNPLFLLKFFSMIVIMGMVYMMFYIWLERSTDFVYGILYAFLFIFVIFWTFPIAIITFNNNSWLTR